MVTKRTALIIGNSSGIGLGITRRLLAKPEFSVWGISRSLSPLTQTNYHHHVFDVGAHDFEEKLNAYVGKLDQVDLCIYCAGIGDELDINNLNFETMVFRVNTMGAVIATNVVLTKIKKQGFGHFIGLSSIADNITSKEAPSYSASKVGVSYYWEGLAQNYSGTGISLSNVRFGFVDTKMAKAPIKPMQMDVETAVDFLEDVIARPRIRATKPLLMGFLTSILGFFSRVKFLGK